MGDEERRPATQDARGSHKYVSSASAQEWQLSFEQASQSLLSPKLGLQTLEKLEPTIHIRVARALVLRLLDTLHTGLRPMSWAMHMS